MKTQNNLAAAKTGSLVAMSRVGGFTFIELIAVIILLGLLAAAAIPRFLNATDNAQEAALQGFAGGFSSAVAIAKGQWITDGFEKGGPTTPANKVAINLDGSIVYMNEFGWPANTDPGLDAGADNQTAVECQQVLDTILQNPPKSTTVVSERSKARFFISALSGAGGDDIGNTGDVCRYELITSSPTPQYYFDYDLVDGQVIAVTP